jgi:hypothetical protein
MVTLRRGRGRAEHPGGDWGEEWEAEDGSLMLARAVGSERGRQWCGVVWHSIEVVNPWRRGSDPPLRTWRGVLEALEQDCSLQVETGKAVSGPDPTCQPLRTQLHTSLCEITLAIVNFVIKYISNLFPNVTPREDG